MKLQWSWNVPLELIHDHPITAVYWEGYLWDAVSNQSQLYEAGENHSYMTPPCSQETQNLFPVKRKYYHLIQLIVWLCWEFVRNAGVFVAVWWQSHLEINLFIILSGGALVPYAKTKIICTCMKLFHQIAIAIIWSYSFFFTAENPFVQDFIQKHSQFQLT